MRGLRETVGGSRGSGAVVGEEMGVGDDKNEQVSLWVVTEECSTRHQIETNCWPINILFTMKQRQSCKIQEPSTFPIC